MDYEYVLIMEAALLIKAACSNYTFLPDLQ